VIVWTQNELAMVESALRAGITPSACKTWFPNRSRQAIRSCFERVRLRLGIRGVRGRPVSIATIEAEGIDATASITAAAANAREGSRALLYRQLQTGQYFGQARAAYIARHGSMAA
jgi:hypothetical protein